MQESIALSQLPDAFSHVLLVPDVSCAACRDGCIFLSSALQAEIVGMNSFEAMVADSAAATGGDEGP